MISRPDIFRNVKNEFEKEAANSKKIMGSCIKVLGKSKRTPHKAGAYTQPTTKMEVQNDVQYNFSASQPTSGSQDYSFGKTKVNIEAIKY